MEAAEGVMAARVVEAAAGLDKLEATAAAYITDGGTLATAASVMFF